MWLRIFRASSHLPSSEMYVRLAFQGHGRRAMDGAQLAKAPMGTSLEHIWANAPNNREPVSAKHHNKIVFLIKILFLT